jgi:hypothetical protein
MMMRNNIINVLNYVCENFYEKKISLNFRKKHPEKRVFTFSFRCIRVKNPSFSLTNENFRCSKVSHPAHNISTINGSKAYTRLLNGEN